MVLSYRQVIGSKPDMDAANDVIHHNIQNGKQKRKRRGAAKGSRVSKRDVFPRHEKVIQPFASSKGQTIGKAASKSQNPNNMINFIDKQIKTEIKEEPVDQNNEDLTQTNISEGCVNTKQDLNGTLPVSQYRCEPCGQYFCTESILLVHSRFHQRLQICSCDICDMPYKPDVDSEDTKQYTCDRKEAIITFLNVLKSNQKSNQEPFVEQSNIQNTDTRMMNTCIANPNIPSTSNGQTVQNLYVTNTNIQNPYTQGVYMWSAPVVQHVQNPCMEGLSSQSTQGINYWISHINPNVQNSYVEWQNIQNAQRFNVENTHTTGSNVWSTQLKHNVNRLMIDEPNVQRAHTADNTVRKPHSKVTQKIPKSTIKNVAVPCNREITADKNVLSGNRILKPHVANANVQKIHTEELQPNVQRAHTVNNIVRKSRSEVTNTQKIPKSSIKNVAGPCNREITADKNVLSGNRILKPYVANARVQKIRTEELLTRNTQLTIQNAPFVKENEHQVVQIGNLSIRRVTVPHCRKPATDAQMEINKKPNPDRETLNVHVTHMGEGDVQRNNSVGQHEIQKPNLKGATIGQGTGKSPRAAEELFDSVTGSNSFNCDICQAHFKTRSHLVNHYETHSADKYTCDRCNREFKTRKSLNCHQKNFCKKSGVDTRVSCGKCQKQFCGKSTLYKHQRYRCYDKTGDLPFACELCENKFPDEHLLTRHVKMKHSKSFECEICNKVFSENYHYNQHILIHAGLMPFRCSLCPEEFRRKERLKYHEMMHAGVKFNCKVCGKAFTDLTTEKRHERLYCNETVVRKKPYVCDVCKRRCATKEGIKRHLLSCHTASFTCDLCNKTFGNKMSLTIHLHHRHTGIYPTCDVCKKWYRNKKSLIEHLRTHE